MLQNNELKSDGLWLCYETHLKKQTKQNTPNPLKQGIVDWFYFQVNIRVLQHLKMLWSFILETWLQKDYFKFKSLLFK